MTLFEIRQIIQKSELNRPNCRTETRQFLSTLASDYSVALTLTLNQKWFDKCGLMRVEHYLKKEDTSMGTVSSSFMPTYEPQAYAGAIHTATITEPYAKHSYRELGGFDYSKAKISQFFIHHKNDPCPLTTYSAAKSISQKFNLPLVSVTGGSDFEGPACKAMTEHGFRGKEKEVMKAIAEIIRTGAPVQLEIN